MNKQLSTTKLKALLHLSLSLIGFGTALATVLSDVNALARVLSLTGAFLAGWGCCSSLGTMVGSINTAKSEKL